jgi:hypothetical protein
MNSLLREAALLRSHFGLPRKCFRERLAILATAGVKLAIDTARLPGRLATGQVFDETIESGSRSKQMESYYQALAAVMFDPNAADTIGDAYKYFNRIGYTAGQGVARGVREKC